MRTLAIALLSMMVMSLPAAAVKQGQAEKLQVKSPSIHTQPLVKAKTASKPVNKTPVATAATPKVVASQQPAPEQPAQPAPQPIVYPVGCANYLPIVSQYNWNVSVAMAIMQAESSCNPNDVSPAYLNYDGISDYGLFQIHGEAIFDPASNVLRAYQKYASAGGFTPWTTYTSGKYLRFL